MRKTTHYKVSGVLETKPANLPEGLEVEEVEVTLPKESVNIRAIHGGSSVLISEYDLGKSSYENPGIRIPGKGIFEASEVRKLRDFLNVILDGPHNMRVFRDSTGDLWFELEPGRFTCGPKYLGDGPLQAARNCLADLQDDNYVDWSLERLRGHYSSLTEVTDTWEA